jgi:phosphotransacetylase
MATPNDLATRERAACVAYLRAEAEKLQAQYNSVRARTHTRASLLGAIMALRSAADAIESGAAGAYAPSAPEGT